MPPPPSPHPFPSSSPAGISWLDRYASGAWCGEAWRWPVRCLARPAVYCWRSIGLIVAADSLPLLVLIVVACRLGRYCSSWFQAGSSSREPDARHASPRRLQNNMFHWTGSERLGKVAQRQAERRLLPLLLTVWNGILSLIHLTTDIRCCHITTKM